MQISSKFRTGALYAAASTIALSAGALLVPLSASAQDKNNNSSAVSEVIVTAQKRSENLQTVPVAITAFTAKERDRAGIVSAQDQMNFTPGVTYDPSTDHLDIRGVGKVTTYIGTDPGVAVYQDGFYVESAAQINQTTLESDRTEVLRGPQGTLYGRNSIGGAVNSISRRPDDEYNGEVRASWNDYVGETVEARVSGPVTDWLKLSAYFEENSQRHGYFTTVAPHTAPAAPASSGNATTGPQPAFPAATCSNLNFSTVQPLTCGSFKGDPGTGGIGNGWITDLQASWNAGPSFDGWVKIRLWNEWSRPNQGAAVSPWDPIALTIPSVYYGFQGSQQPGLYRSRDVTANMPNSATTNNKQFITQDTWHAPGFDVKFIGGYWDYKNTYVEDGDSVSVPVSGNYVPTYEGLNNIPVNGMQFGPNLPVSPSNPQSGTTIDANNLEVSLPSQFQSWSTELNIASTTKGPFQWLAGAYYYSEQNHFQGTFLELDTPQYDHVTDYLFQNTCLPVNLALPTNPNAVENDNAPFGGGPGVVGGGCGLQNIFGGAPTTIAPTFGYVPSNNLNGPGGTPGPSTIDNAPGGALIHQFHNDEGQNMPGLGCLYCNEADLQTQSEALFAQIDWKPNDQWHFTLGGRYSWDQKQGFEKVIDVFAFPLVDTQAQAAALGLPIDPQTGQYATWYVATSCSIVGPVTNPPTDGIMPYDSTHQCPSHRHLTDQWQAPTGTAGVEWTPSTDTTVYVRYNRGYKSGGFNLGAVVAGSGTVGPEYIDDFEGGWKQSFGHTFQFDVAAFYYLYHGLQAVNATVQNSSPPIVLNELINIQESHAWGVELEAKWSPLENLLILLNYSYLNTTNDTVCSITGSGASLKETNCFIDAANPLALNSVNGLALTGVNPIGPMVGGQQPQSLAGDGLPYSPSHKVSANVSYTFKFEPGDLTLSAVENFHTSFYDNLFPTQQWLVPAGDTTDFRITWASHSGKYQVIGTVSNAFNHDVLTAYTTLPPSNAYFASDSLENPRIFTVELRYKF